MKLYKLILSEYRMLYLLRDKNVAMYENYHMAQNYDGKKV